MVKRLILLLTILIVVLVSPAFAGGNKDVSSTGTTERTLTGNPLRGGLLYDEWWAALEIGPPEGDQALWATQSTNSRSGTDSWRCKECHGWDYKGEKGAYSSGSHATGFSGVLDSAGKGDAYVLGALKGQTNSDHDFSQVMDDQALTDLALFVAELTMDFSRIIGSDKKAIGGDLAEGKKLFEGECAKCHGPNGLAMNFGHVVVELEYLGGLALGNPWEFTHKLTFGQPGEKEMTSAIVDKSWTEEQRLSILAHVQTLSNSSPITEGGVLYDKWWDALGLEKPEDDHPLWATQSTNKRSGADTWRCKECHGWDYKGAEGAYGSGSHATGFTGILGASSKSASQLTEWLDGSADERHDFSIFMGHDQIDMLVAFIQDGLVDTSSYINTDKSVNGDAGNGETRFKASCERCHGEDGKKINFGSPKDPEFLGTVAAGNPWEFFHKASFGQPGEHMPSGINLGFSNQDRVDIIAHVQSFPTE